MSNLIFNISLGQWHLQITRWPWMPSLSYNHHTVRPWHRLTVHCAFGHHFA